MRTKEELLTELQNGIDTGVLTESELKSFLFSKQPEVALANEAGRDNKPEKLSAVDVMFYIAGIVLFSTIMSIIAQSWNDGTPLIHILLSGVIGVGLWSVAYALIKGQQQNEIRKGLTNALLLTGSLLVVVGGYITTNEVVKGFDAVNYIPSAFTLAVLGSLHLGFDKMIKRDLILLMGVLLTVSSFPVLLFGILQNTGASMSVWTSIMIISCGILVRATRVIAKIYPDRTKIATSFDSLAAFLALMSMYVSSFGEYGILWLSILIAAVFAIFYMSIVLQNKHLLGNGSFFMVLTIITISFKYFSGFGITFSLIIATLGLLASAATASSINKKYFKNPA